MIFGSGLLFWGHPVYKLVDFFPPVPKVALQVPQNAVSLWFNDKQFNKGAGPNICVVLLKLVQSNAHHQSYPTFVIHCEVNKISVCFNTLFTVSIPLRLLTF